MPWLQTMLAAAVLSAATAGPSRVHVVCPAGPSAAGCDFSGGAGIQAAVDVAQNGDTILIRSGHYSATVYRDVPFKVHTIRGWIVVAGKRLTLAGDPGAVLDGSIGPPTTAIVVHRADLTIRGLTLAGLRYDQQEDETYEGHGVFAIDSRLVLDDLRIDRFQKMGLVGRGSSTLDAVRVWITNGHVGIWLRESASLRMRDCVVRGNDGSGIAAYADTVVHASNSIFDGNLDDGLYTDEQATIFATNVLLLNNRPVAAHAKGTSRIWVRHTGVFGNEANFVSADRGYVDIGAQVITADPRIDADYRLRADSPLQGKGDPELGEPVGRPSN